jgi:hypothetical protein
MVTVSQLISVIKKRQAEIAFSLGAGNASTWESYQRMVGIYMGHQEVLDTVNNLLKEEEEKENER